MKGWHKAIALAAPDVGLALGRDGHRGQLWGTGTEIACSSILLALSWTVRKERRCIRARLPFVRILFSSTGAVWQGAL
jgi:hypothetical protein